MIRDTRSVVERYGFSINDKKTSVMRAGQRQVVTGVVVNNGMHRPREVRREMRQALRFVTRYGFDEHCARIGEEPGDYLLYLRGVASSVLQIDPKDVYARHLLAVLRGVG